MPSDIVPRLTESLKLLQNSVDKNGDCLNSERLAPQATYGLQEPTKASFVTESESSVQKTPNKLVKDGKQHSQKLEVK